MHIAITDLTEVKVLELEIMLDQLGLRHDEHFHTLYGVGWAIVGVELKDFQLYPEAVRAKIFLWLGQETHTIRPIPL